MEKQKQFTIIHDEKKKEYATIINTLVSDMQEVKNVEHSVKIYKRNMNLTDKDCVLFVGDESSKDHRQNFKDKYSKYGVHLGYRGTKAWIYCEKTKWNRKSYKEFHEELLQLYKELDMNPCKVNEFVDAGIKDFIATGEAAAPKCTSSAQLVIWSPVITSAFIVTSSVNSVLSLYYRVLKWIKGLFAESTRVDQQYRFAITLFFKDFLKDYLKIVKGEEDLQQ